MIPIDFGGKVALVTGVGDNESFAWFIAKALQAAGARLVWAVHPRMTRIVEGFLSSDKDDDVASRVLPFGRGTLTVEKVLPCDVSYDTLADVDEKGLEETRRQVTAAGAKALARRTDVSREADVAALADAAERELGGAHLLFNNAGVLVGGCVWERTPDDWSWVLGVNLWGVIHGVRVFVPRMLASKQPCHVVNTASVAGIASMPRW